MITASLALARRRRVAAFTAAAPRVTLLLVSLESARAVRVGRNANQVVRVARILFARVAATGLGGLLSIVGVRLAKGPYARAKSWVAFASGRSSTLSRKRFLRRR